MNTVLFNARGGLGTLILNNPNKLNAFDLGMMKKLDKILEKIKKSILKVLIIRGEGKNFCTGGDIAWERQIGNISWKEAKKQIKFMQNTISKIEELPQVVIAVIDGYAIGGGNELAMACDIRVALPNAKFVHPETSLGTVAPLGGTKRLPRLIGLGRAKYMLFTGDAIDSKTAVEWGLVDFLVDKSKINDFLQELTLKIISKPRRGLELTKKSVNKVYYKDLHDEFEADSYVKCSRTKENKEKLERFLSKKSIKIL